MQKSQLCTFWPLDVSLIVSRVFNSKGTQMVPEVIFVKPEVTYSNRKWNFYNWRRPLRVIESAFEALFGYLRSQKRLKPTFCT